MRSDPETNSLTSLASAYRKSPSLAPSLPLSLLYTSSSLALCWPSVLLRCDATPSTPPPWTVFLNQAWIFQIQFFFPPFITPFLQPKRGFLKSGWDFDFLSVHPVQLLSQHRAKSLLFGGINSYFFPFQRYTLQVNYMTWCTSWGELRWEWRPWLHI